MWRRLLCQGVVEWNRWEESMEKEEAYVLMMEAFDKDADKAGASYHCVCTGKEDTIVP